MEPTLKPTSEEKSGSQQKVGEGGLRSWEIAKLQIELDDGKLVDVEHATDEQFQQLVARSGIEVEDTGVPEWSFEDRCRLINYARQLGMSLAFKREVAAETE